MPRHAFVRVFVVACLLTIPAHVAAGPAEAQTTPAQHEQTFRLGPFDLAAAGQPGDHISRLFEEVPRPAGDIAVTAIDWRFVDEHGTNVHPHMAHLHHLVLLDTARPDQLCSFPSSSRFAGTGMELSPFSLPEPYAYHSPAGASWQGIYELMNLSAEPMTVSVEYTVQWSDPGQFLDVEPYFLDASGCWGDSTYVVPGGGGAGSVHEQTRSYTMTRDGIIVVGGGHLHVGGIDLVLDGPDGEVCRSTAVYDDENGHHDHLVDIIPCGRMDEEFDVGDEYTLTSRYSNEHHIPDAMGIMLVWVHHTDPPPPLPTVDVQGAALSDQGLAVTLVCEHAREVSLNARVTQRKGPVTVSGWGYEAVGCLAEPTTVTIPLSGNGVLTGGRVDFYAGASATDGRRYVSDSLSGSVHLRGRYDLVPAPPPDGGPIPITIHPTADRSDAGPVVTGTVRCDSPGRLFVQVEGTQPVGRSVVPFYGSATVACDGETPFAATVYSSNGRLAGGPANVTVYAYNFSPGGYSLASQRVVLQGGPPSQPLPPPDPDSPLALTSVRKVANGVEVTATYRACPSGATLFVDALVQPSTGRGRRVVPPEPHWTYAESVCTDGDATVVLPAVPAPRGNWVIVEAFAGVYHDNTFESASNWGEFKLKG